MRLDASKMRRKTPQAPPDRCWIIISAIEPERDAEEQQEGDQPGAEEVVAGTTKPMAQTTRPATPTMQGARAHGLEVGAGGV